jgi:hypothetical protein
LEPQNCDYSNQRAGAECPCSVEMSGLWYLTKEGTENIFHVPIHAILRLCRPVREFQLVWWWDGDGDKTVKRAKKEKGDGYGAAVNTGTGNAKELRNNIRATIHVQNWTGVYFTINTNPLLLQSSSPSATPTEKFSAQHCPHYHHLLRRFTTNTSLRTSRCLHSRRRDLNSCITSLPPPTTPKSIWASPEDLRRSYIVRIYCLKQSYRRNSIDISRSK